MQKSVLNKRGKFGVKILWCYTDMAIFVLMCFILTHPVHTDDIIMTAAIILVQQYDRLKTPQQRRMDGWCSLLIMSPKILYNTTQYNICNTHNVCQLALAESEILCL